MDPLRTKLSSLYDAFQATPIKENKLSGWLKIEQKISFPSFKGKKIEKIADWKNLSFEKKSLWTSVKAFFLSRYKGKKTFPVLKNLLEDGIKELNFLSPVDKQKLFTCFAYYKHFLSRYSKKYPEYTYKTELFAPIQTLENVISQKTDETDQKKAFKEWALQVVKDYKTQIEQETDIKQCAKYLQDLVEFIEEAIGEKLPVPDFEQNKAQENTKQLKKAEIGSELPENWFTIFETQQTDRSQLGVEQKELEPHIEGTEPFLTLEQALKPLQEQMSILFNYTNSEHESQRLLANWYTHLFMYHIQTDRDSDPQFIQKYSDPKFIESMIKLCNQACIEIEKERSSLQEDLNINIERLTDCQDLLNQETYESLKKEWQEHVDLLSKLQNIQNDPFTFLNTPPPNLEDGLHPESLFDQLSKITTFNKRTCDLYQDLCPLQGRIEELEMQTKEGTEYQRQLANWYKHAILHAFKQEKKFKLTELGEIGDNAIRSVACKNEIFTNLEDQLTNIAKTIEDNSLLLPETKHEEFRRLLEEYRKELEKLTPPNDPFLFYPLPKDNLIALQPFIIRRSPLSESINTLEQEVTATILPARERLKQANQYYKSIKLNLSILRKNLELEPILEGMNVCPTAINESELKQLECLHTFLKNLLTIFSLPELVDRPAIKWIIHTLQIAKEQPLERKMEFTTLAIEEAKKKYSSLRLDHILDEQAIHELGEMYEKSRGELFDPQGAFPSPAERLWDIIYEFRQRYKLAISAKSALKFKIEEILSRKPLSPHINRKKIQITIRAIQNQIPKISEIEGKNGTVTKLTEKYAQIFSEISERADQKESFYSSLVLFKEFIDYFTNPNVFQAQKQLARWYFLAIDALFQMEGFDLDFYLEKALAMLKSVEDSDELAADTFWTQLMNNLQLLECMRILDEPKIEDFSNLPINRPNKFGKAFTEFRSALKKDLKDSEQ